ncbi:hypothetical protein [Streptomyces sp. WAC06614]|uniref:hypothetical protein n=1 Tax=Streptomyces sp. WAC06614 TaxID=2487416 RepID=UPI000F79A205|nr:hypothetical protein [Streptomyces sp. WAC06614]RSS83233.1 hypothetical protein EF918_04275 [Streptomyces sp. WAC06614]
MSAPNTVQRLGFGLLGSLLAGGLLLSACVTPEGRTHTRGKAVLRHPDGGGPARLRDRAADRSSRAGRPGCGLGGPRARGLGLRP